jgi:hypothetical protein
MEAVAETAAERLAAAAAARVTAVGVRAVG